MKCKRCVQSIEHMQSFCPLIVELLSNVEHCLELLDFENVKLSHIEKPVH